MHNTIEQALNTKFAAKAAYRVPGHNWMALHAAVDAVTASNNMAQDAELTASEIVGRYHGFSTTTFMSNDAAIARCSNCGSLAVYVYANSEDEVKRIVKALRVEVKARDLQMVKK